MSAKSARAYEVRHKVLGLCIACFEKATRGVRCRNHWLRHKEVMKDFYMRTTQKRKDKGLCTHCATPLDPESDGTNEICVNCNCTRLRQFERRRNYK